MDQAVAAHNPDFVVHLHSEEFIHRRVHRARCRAMAAAGPFVLLGISSIVLLSVWTVLRNGDTQTDSTTGLEIRGQTYDKLLGISMGMSMYVWSSWLTFVSWIGGICMVHYVQLRGICVNTASAGCNRQSDIDMITASVMDHGGFEALDERIFQLRVAALQHVPDCMCCGTVWSKFWQRIICGMPSSLTVRRVVIAVWVVAGVLLCYALYFTAWITLCEIDKNKKYSWEHCEGYETHACRDASGQWYMSDMKCVRYTCQTTTCPQETIQQFQDDCPSNVQGGMWSCSDPVNYDGQALTVADMCCNSCPRAGSLTSTYEREYPCFCGDTQLLPAEAMESCMEPDTVMQVTQTDVCANNDETVSAVFGEDYGWHTCAELIAGDSSKCSQTLCASCEGAGVCDKECGFCS